MCTYFKKIKVGRRTIAFSRVKLIDTEYTCGLKSASSLENVAICEDYWGKKQGTQQKVVPEQTELILVLSSFSSLMSYTKEMFSLWPVDHSQDSHSEIPPNKLLAMVFQS